MTTNKYRAKKTVYNGRIYDSAAEARVAAQLDVGVRAGTVSWWLPQVSVLLGPLKYTPDFLVAEPCDAPSSAESMPFLIHFVDVKGFATQRWRDVRKMWATYGPSPLRVIMGGKHIETIIRAKREDV